MLPTMVKKTMDRHVLPNLTLATTVFVSFNLWMSRSRVDIFALVINFLSDNWVPMHIIMGLFEVNETTTSFVGQIWSIALSYCIRKR
jgi:hypothetical protein